MSNIHQDYFKNVTSRVLTIFPLIRPGDLVFDSRGPSFELDLDFIDTNILSKFLQDWIKTVTSSVLTNLLLMKDDGPRVLTIAHHELSLR